MNIVELGFIALGLSMDAFAVSVCTGLAVERVNLKHALTVGLYFGVFQALMPVIGYFLGIQFAAYIVAVDHWIAFILLAGIGVNMVHESRQKDDPASMRKAYAIKPGKMLLLALATSIDALAVGVTFAFLNIRIIPAVSLIGVTTLLLSIAGAKIGNIFGVKYKAKAELLGGVILILMGTKILLEHVGIFG